MKQTDWACDCGAFQARIDLRGSARVVCYCKFCRAFAHHSGAAEQLDEAGGTDLIQSVPERPSILAGAKHLRCLRLSCKGPLRWYVGCCGTPIGSIFARRSLPYLAVWSAGVTDRGQLSPVQVRANLAGARGPVDASGQRWATVLFGLARRTIGSLLTGHFRDTQFFDRDGAPVAKVERLTPEQKSAAFAASEGS
ncbi:MAG: DUF6151 family protein [Boseongicola sp.]